MYDEPLDEPVVARDQFYVDASAWDKWYYIDLDKVCLRQEADPEYDASTAIVAMDVEREMTGEKQYAPTGQELTGQYMYWFDVLGEGLQNRRFEWFAPTNEQPAPDSWTLAIHRTNFRTNGGSVWDEKAQQWREDEWTESEVWNDNSQMLNCYVPSQGIRLNPLLCSWLVMEIPPIPPSFTFSPRALKLRDKDGRVFLLEMLDYMSTRGTKCCYTIKFQRL